MTPIGFQNSGTAWFLNGLANLQQQETLTQRELSSGFQINDASDSPSQTPELIQLGSSLAAVQTWQTNIASVQTETTAADQAIGAGISLIQSAETLAAQGNNTSSSAAADQTLAAQVQGIQQQLVSIANTTVDNRTIFGGDQDQTAPYQYDAASPAGVDRLTPQTSTRVVVDPDGQTVYHPLTARQIFDPEDATGAPTANNTFAALQSLYTALRSNDQPAIADALTSLQSASTYVNQQQAYYGAAEQRLSSETNNAANLVTNLQAQIGNIRDTNVAQAATDLTQESTDQSAALGAEAEISPKTLFDYLG
jgi:flagellar hook-associated protein 3 FlgL